MFSLLLLEVVFESDETKTCALRAAVLVGLATRLFRTRRLVARQPSCHESPVAFFKTYTIQIYVYLQSGVVLHSRQGRSFLTSPDYLSFCPGKSMGVGQK